MNARNTKAAGGRPRAGMHCRAGYWWSTVCVAAGLGLVGAGAAPASWDPFSDTWVATDGLGRVLPTHAEAGPVRPGKTVGLFYFLWLGSHGRDLYDNTRLRAARPEAPMYGPPGAFHFWGEPLLGYYLSDDGFVIRKHAQQLSDAGVEVVVFDVTNGFTYDEVVRRLGEEYLAWRRLGNRTPQIAFLAHSGEGAVVQRLYDTLYAPGRFAELWFRWEGKPLVLARPAALAPALTNFFTVRESWAWSDPGGWFGDGRDRWPWLDHHPQRPGWHARSDLPEQISVCAAQHPTSNIGRSYQSGRQPPPGQERPELGLCFSEQWTRALAVDPALVFVTGWNEWVAQRFVSDAGGQSFLGQPLPPGGTFFVDQFSQEFSRDLEPMRGGHGDHYYYQLVANIRRYRGVRPIPSLVSAPIEVDGRFDDWTPVQPEFRDTLGDPARRDHDGWNGAGRYVNATGRNDLEVAKVSRVGTNTCFYARTREALTPPGPDWMLLFIDVDRSAATGWLGYDLVVNRTRTMEGQAAVERHIGPGYAWSAVTAVPLRYAGTELELSVPNAWLGARGGLDFKWADGIRQDGDWSDFTLHGDAAPNDRFNYRVTGLE